MCGQFLAKFLAINKDKPKDKFKSKIRLNPNYLKYEQNDTLSLKTW